VLWITLFNPLLTLGEPQAVDFDEIPFVLVFLVQGLLLAALFAWYAMGYLPFGLPGEDPRLRERFHAHRARVLRELGLEVENPWQEMRIGLVAGVFAWATALGVTMIFAVILGIFLMLFGAENLLPQEPPPAIVWIAGLPVAHRLAIALAAGVVEELFFRGFLQRRLGLAAATVFFVLAHAGYGQPLLFFSITLLSVLYGLLVKWRGNVLAAMVAHFLFDAIQLLVVIPAVLKLVEIAPAAFVPGIC
jgi:membrane protease YdiL (CAAX protease family)